MSVAYKTEAFLLLLYCDFDLQSQKTEMEKKKRWGGSKTEKRERQEKRVLPTGYFLAIK